MKSPSESQMLPKKKKNLGLVIGYHCTRAQPKL